MGAGGRRRTLGRLGIVFGAIVLIAAVWAGTIDAGNVQRREALAREETLASNQALLFEDQFRGQLVALDQTLRILEREWEKSPESFDINAWRRRTVVLNDLSLHVFLADESGIIRNSTRPELIGVDISGRDYFHYERDLPQDDGQMFIGPSTRGLVTKRLQMNMARRLDAADGAFAGVIGISYDTRALTNFYKEADLGSRGMVALVGARDGQIRALVGPGADDLPNQGIADSPMFRAMTANPDGTWVGPSVPDGLLRIHAFRTVAKRDMAVVVGFDAAEALQSASSWRRGAQVFATIMSLFVVILSLMLLREMAAAAERERGLGRDRAVLARANADLGAARDRADRRSAELQATLAGMSDGVSVLDGNLKLLQWNDNFAAFTGVPPALLRPGAPWQDILRAQAMAGEFGPVDIEQEVQRRMAMFRTGSMSGVVERNRPNGRTVELRRTRMPDGGYVTLYSDITTRKQAEDALRRAREAAEAATVEKSRFVATVSHEIRAPLNAVLNSLALLAETSMSAGQQRMVTMAAQSGDALLNLITDILEMSKMEAGRLTLRPAEFTLAPMLEGVLSMFRPTAAARRITLSPRIDVGVPEVVHTDPGRLRQVLINLVSNAAKFAGPGQVELVAETRVDGGQTLLRLVVRDQGPAIPAEDRARLFVPFSRLENGGAGAVPGTGLGLAICRRLAALLGGTIGCEVTEEGGNAFWIMLPFKRETGRDASEVGGRRRPLPRTRILLVEDIEANQIITATMLRREGHCVEVADSGEAALERLAREPYDFVLMDVFMPGISGFEATRRLRAMSGPSRAVPVVALTANVSDEDRARCREAGMNDMLSKPIDTARLLDSLAEHVWSGRRSQLPLPDASAADRTGSATLDRDRLRELRDNLSPPVLERLIEQCLTDVADRLPVLETQLHGADAERIEAEAHALAGMAGGYAMAKFDQMLRRVMAAAAAGDVAAAQRHGGGLAAEFAHARAALLAAVAPETV